MGSVGNAGHGGLLSVLFLLLGASVAIVCALTLSVGTALAAEPTYQVVDVREDGTDPDLSGQRPSKPVGEVRDDGYVLTEFAHYEEERLMGTGTVLGMFCIKDKAAFGYYGSGRPKDDLDIDWEFLEYETQRYNGHGSVSSVARGPNGPIPQIPNPHCPAYPEQGFWRDFTDKADRILGYETRRVVDFTCWATPDGRHDPNCTDPTHDDSHVDMVLKDFGHNVKTHYVTVEMPWTDEDGYYLTPGNHSEENNELHIRNVRQPDWVVDVESLQKWEDQMNKTRKPRISELDTNRTHIDFRCWATLDGTHDPNCTDPSHVIVAEEQAPTRVNDSVARNGLDGLRRAGEDLEPYFSMLDREGFDTSGLRKDYAPPVKVYRLYNPYNGDHHYTTDLGEYTALDAAGWDGEGEAWESPASGIPVYRLYNHWSGEHHYTWDAQEKDNLVNGGWTDEGVGWYSFSFGLPVYRLYNPYKIGPGAHHYTKSEEERDSLVKAGWKDEGIGWIRYEAA